MVQKLRNLNARDPNERASPESASARPERTDPKITQIILQQGSKRFGLQLPRSPTSS
jgi:hypothetical protein